MKNRSDIKLYNILFPIWMLMILPTAWIAVLPLNFIVDSLVLVICSKKLGIWVDGIYKKHILKVWIFGFLADLIGALYIFIIMWGFELDTQPDDIRITLPALLISAVLILVFNFFISFKDIDKKSRFKMAFIFALVTAPYTFLIPLSWIY